MKLIPLTHGLFAQVDDADFDWLNQWKWCAVSNYSKYKRAYAARSVKEGPKWRTVRMHRLILGITDSEVLGDHRNGDSLDNRRSNLRTATPQQNSFNQRISRSNKSGFKGISYDQNTGSWQAKITVNRRHKYLGRFKTPAEAAQAYTNAAQEIHGEFFNPETIAALTLKG